jgi:hypothetical protein
MVCSQHDFPSTPSSVYSKRIFDPELKDADLKVPPLSESQANATAQAPRSLALLGGAALPNNNGNVTGPSDASNGLEQATKSLEKLYVNPQDLSPKSISGAPPTKPLLNQYVGSAPAGSILSSVQSDLSFTNAAGAKPYTGSKPTGGQSPYNALLGNNPSAILNNGLNPLAPSVAMGGMLGMPPAPHGATQGNSAVQGGATAPQQAPQVGQTQPPAAQNAQQAPQQPAYYVQQAVYLDANGQPMFYRPSKFTLFQTAPCA